MAGGRRRGRRKAAESGGDQNDSRWTNAIRIRLPQGVPASNQPDGVPLPQCSSQASQRTDAGEETDSILELTTGFRSPTRTIFARVVRRSKATESTNGERDAPESRDRRRCWRVEDLVEAIVNETVLREKEGDEADDTESITSKRAFESISFRTLLQLGSVWVLDPASADRPQNKPVWRRLLEENGDDQTIATDEQDSCLLWFDDTMTLRVHSQPARYPMARRFRMALEEQLLPGNGTRVRNIRTASIGANTCGGIVFERPFVRDPGVEDERNNDNALAFAVLNKPVGLPSHSTVDNAVENLLYQYQRCRKLGYASLPQRLDTETSGLVLIATHPRFATYFSKLLEQKTGIASPGSPPTSSSSSSSSSLPPVASNPSIRKRYRCLVVFPEESSMVLRDTIQKKFVLPQKIVEHYVDANSRAPKTFVDASEFKDGGCVTAKASATINGGEESTHKWQLCKLLIRSMTLPIKPPHTVSEEKFNPGPERLVCSELEIELLTGRTHQIRGQLAALGCPIFGDPLYGGMPLLQNPMDWRDRSSFRMALQCCQLAFPIDISLSLCQAEGDPPKRRKSGDRNSAKDISTSSDPISNDKSEDFPRFLTFRLDSAWWRDA